MYYKIVRIRYSDEESELVSMAAEGVAMRTYKPGEWTYQPPNLGGLFVYDSYEQAILSMNLPYVETETLEETWMRVTKRHQLWECEVGEVEEPTFDFLELAPLRFGIKTPEDRRFPKGALVTNKVKLTNILIGDK